MDLATIETALNANRVTEMKAQLAQAVKDGTMTQEEADWWTTGIDKGWVGGGHGGFGMMGPRRASRAWWRLRAAWRGARRPPLRGPHRRPSTGTTS